MGCNRSGFKVQGFRVERLKVDLDPEPWDAFPIRINRNRKLNIQYSIDIIQSFCRGQGDH